MTLEEVNAELKLVNQRRKELLSEQRRLKKERESGTSQYWGDLIFKIIETHPGIDRRTILNEMNDDQLNDKALTNCLTTLRRRGVIQNLGSKKRPEWRTTA